MYHYMTALVANPPTFITSLPIFIIGGSLAIAASSLEPLDASYGCTCCGACEAEAGSKASSQACQAPCLLPAEPITYGREWLLYPAFAFFYIGCCGAFLLTRAIAQGATYTVTGVVGLKERITSNSSFNCYLHCFLLVVSLVFAFIDGTGKFGYIFALINFAVLWLSLVSVRIRLLDPLYKVLFPRAALWPRSFSGGCHEAVLNRVSTCLKAMGKLVSKFPWLATLTEQAGRTEFKDPTVQ